MKKKVEVKKYKGRKKHGNMPSRHRKRKENTFKKLKNIVAHYCQTLSVPYPTYESNIAFIKQNYITTHGNFSSLANDILLHDSIFQPILVLGEKMNINLFKGDNFLDYIQHYCKESWSGDKPRKLFIHNKLITFPSTKSWSLFFFHPKLKEEWNKFKDIPTKPAILHFHIENCLNSWNINMLSELKNNTTSITIEDLRQLYEQEAKKSKHILWGDMMMSQDEDESLSD